jgi:hypothetical protein
MRRENTMKMDQQLATEAKAIVALAFRNGPIENLHAGVECPACKEDPNVSHISQTEMKALMKSAVDRVYKLLWLKGHDPDAYQEQIAFGSRYTSRWDEPKITR